MASAGPPAPAARPWASSPCLCAGVLCPSLPPELVFPVRLQLSVAAQPGFPPCMLTPPYPHFKFFFFLSFFNFLPGSALLMRSFRRGPLCHLSRLHLARISESSSRRPGGARPRESCGARRGAGRGGGAQGGEEQPPARRSRGSEAQPLPASGRRANGRGYGRRAARAGEPARGAERAGAGAGSGSPRVPDDLRRPWHPGARPLAAPPPGASPASAPLFSRAPPRRPLPCCRAAAVAAAAAPPARSG